MAVGSSSCSSLPAQDLELEREMKIYIHDAADSLGFNLKTEQDESIFLVFISLSTGFGKSVCYIQSDLLHRVDSKSMEDQHKQNSISPRLL